MAISITCPKCEKAMSVDDAWAGKKCRCPDCRSIVEVPLLARPVEESVLQAKARPRPSSRNEVDEPPLIQPRNREESGYREPRRRDDASFPIGWVLGGLGAGVGLIIVVIVVVFILQDRPVPPAPGPFVEMKGPGMNVKIELPKDFPQVVVPPEFGQIQVPQPGPVVLPPPIVIAPPNPAPKDVKPGPSKPPVEQEDPDPINRALKKVRSNSLHDQAQGVKILQQLEPVAKRRAEVVEALKRVAGTPGGLAARADAVRTLARWGTKAEVPFLVGLIDHQDRGVREAVIVTLGQWKEAIDPIAQRLVNGDDRPWASQALKDIGPAAEKPVMELVRHPNADVRLEACRVLRALGGKAAHAALIEAADDPDERVVQAAREALPPELRPPVYGPNQFMKLNVHVRNPKSWPEIETKLRKLADAPKTIIKVNTSGDYKWVELAPVSSDAETFARRITFAKIVAVHNNQRLIYIDPGK